jgi:hypothetical protein
MPRLLSRQAWNVLHMAETATTASYGHCRLFRGLLILCADENASQIGLHGYHM